MELGMVRGEEVEGLGVVQVDNREVQVEVVEARDLPHLILWRVTSAGCVAIWPVTVPAPVHSRIRWEVAQPTLPVEHFPNPGKKAQEDVAEVDYFGLEASMSYMTRLETSIQWMMQVNCTSPSDMNPWRPKR